jgi:hypothetical protein
MSNISALLKEAAHEVAHEEKQETEENFKIAAEQINEERISAKEGKSPKSNGASTPVPIHMQNINVSEDVHALLEDMSLKPKYGGNTMDDVDALLNMHKKEIKIESSPEKSPRKNISMDNYRKRKTARSAKSTTSSRANQTWTGFNAEQSRLSVLLSRADASIDENQARRYSFKSPHHELLCRSMKVVRPSTAGTRRSSSGGGDAKGGDTRSVASGLTYGRSSNYNMTGSSTLLRKSIAGGVSTGTLRMSQADAYMLTADDKYRTSDLGIHACRSQHEVAEEKASFRSTIRASADRLSFASVRQPSAGDLKVDPTLAYSTYDEAKNCTFRPNIHGKDKKSKKKGHHDDDDDANDANNKFAFVNRQAAIERGRMDDLKFATGKAEYDALVDKKACPQCGSKQSYDEFKEKRKKCAICGVEFCAKVSWAKVSRHFFQSSQEFSQRVAEKKNLLREEIDNEFKCQQRTAIDPQTGKTVTLKIQPKQKLTPQEEMEFFDRIEAMLVKRQDNIQELEAEVYSKDKFSFKPNIAAAKLKAKNDDDDRDDDDENSDTDPVQAFLRRYHADLELRRDKNPSKYLQSKITADEENAPFRTGKF